jgi:predicted O-methyltransferase YrrM
VRALEALEVRVSEDRITDQIAREQRGKSGHGAGMLNYKTLRVLEQLVGASAEQTAETGCGRSTILFSNLSQRHQVFCLDDSADERSSVAFFRNSALTNQTRVATNFGPTQLVLPAFEHNGLYDCVLIDGPHGYPFPDLEYFHFYPRIREGGILAIDDVNIPSIGRMVDIISEDEMWEVVAVSGVTAFLRRTHAPTTSPVGDEWWAQGYNRRRTNVLDFRLKDGRERKAFLDRYQNRTLTSSVKRRAWRLLQGTSFDRRQSVRVLR